MNPAWMPNDWLGYLAAALTTLSFVPQALLTLLLAATILTTKPLVEWRDRPADG